MKIRILGSGTSSGVPRIGNDWGACDPAEPRNRRTRASVLIETTTTRILIDTSPDMREQLNAASVSSFDAVIWTHDHADHCHGIDDLRQIFHAMRRPVRGLARAETLDTLTSRFAYVFDGHDGYPPTVKIEELPDAILIGDVMVRTVDQPHGPFRSAGLRFEADGAAIGYATDVSAITPALAAHYSDLDLWVIDALRRNPHPSHLHLAESLAWIERLAPARAALTHLDQSMDYATLAADLPDNVEPAFDGLEIEARR